MIRLQRYFASRPNCSAAWLNRQNKDHFVKLSHEHNYRSRSSFKLLEIQERYKLIKYGDAVLDCGAAPGGWTQIACDFAKPDTKYAAKMQKIFDDRSEFPVVRQHIRSVETYRSTSRIEEVDGNSWIESEQSDKGLVISVDLKPIVAVSGSILLDNRDLFADDTKTAVKDCLNGRNLDFIMSDMLANLSGQKDADHFKSIESAKRLLELAHDLPMKPGGSILIKILMGGLEMDLKNELRRHFKQVHFIKPDASRKESKEVFLLGRNFLKKKRTYK
jgi:23S rRNA (uridine2552-2'-O)-methyltransferase